MPAVKRRREVFTVPLTAGQRAATFYTLIGNCHCAGIDATAYLTDIFQRLPVETNRSVHRLTPKAWAAEQTAKRQAVAHAAIAVM